LFSLFPTLSIIALWFIARRHQCLRLYSVDW
jgi:hypothetical protein